MRKVILLCVVKFIFILPLLGQSEFDYLLINKIIQEDKSYSTTDSIYFLINPKLNSNKFGSKKRKSKELIEWYSGGINRLLKDSLPQYSDQITNRDIKKSFVNWDKKRINYNFITKDENVDFFYLSKPMLINRELYIIIDINYSGIQISLYSYNNDVLKEIKSRTIKRVGLKFRT
jgi:hypothetical protein